MLYARDRYPQERVQAVVLDPDTGGLDECRFEPSRERLASGRISGRGSSPRSRSSRRPGGAGSRASCSSEASRFVWLTQAVRARSVGVAGVPKTDKLDARWLALVLARELLTECEAWMPPAGIQLLRDQTRLRKSLVNSRSGWAQRLHALLAHEGWPCSRGRLLTREGRRWVTALELDPEVRAQIDVMLTIIEAFDGQVGLVEAELRRFARTDARCLALQTIFGVGPIYSCHLLAEIGDASRFKRSRQVIRASGLDPAAHPRLPSPELHSMARRDVLVSRDSGSRVESQ